MVLWLIASSTTATVSTTSPTTAVEPAPAVSAVIMVATVSEIAVVAARRPTSIASTATTTGAKEDACYQYDHDYYHNNKEYSHPNSPFRDFPKFGHQSTFGRSAVTTLVGGSRTVPTPSRGYASVWVRTHTRRCGSYTVQVTRRDYL